MNLNYLNLTVTDAQKTRRFLETHFELRAIGDGNENMAFLSDDDGLVLRMFRGTHVSYPRLFHIGFIQESRERVNELSERLKADGYDVPPLADSVGHGPFISQLQAGSPLKSCVEQRSSF